MIAQSGKPGLQKQNECLGLRQPHAVESVTSQTFEVPFLIQ